MKVISIGRGADCQVVLDDPTISRRHAILKVYPWGKMELVDMSQNGTYVNGVKLSSNTPYPVSRKDVVSFAHVRRLDWNMIPNPLNYVKYGLLAVVGIAVIVGLVVLFKSLGGETPVEKEEPVVTQPIDQPNAKTPSATEGNKEESGEKVEKGDDIVYPKLPDAPKKDKKKEKPEEKKEKEETKPQEESKPAKPVYV